MNERTRDRWIVTGLMALAVIPTLGGLARLSLLTRGHAPTAHDARLAAQPIAMTLHIAGATLFTLLGSLQFSRSFGRAHRELHRALGWVLAPAGVLGALAGVWLTLALAPSRESSPALVPLRVLVGSAMAASVAFSVYAAIRGDLRAHRRWITRGYALGAASGTQALILLPLALLHLGHSPRVHACALAAGWALNALIAERVLRRRDRERAPSIAMSA